MKFSKPVFSNLSFAALVIAFFFMGAAILDEITFLSVRNAVVSVTWVLIAIWCQRESR
ncbi:MAG: hypothetical protein H0X30_31340 [Anaerolineae bacterium]|nr:hypothetical protein [Anaerolineae bacterium]